ncbi:MAG: ferrous iron transport protein B [candidate division Zixibacteria bacterium]|nr:ferrous iron transport protein B [candidate division Zixibacteria bacterium]
MEKEKGIDSVLAGVGITKTVKVGLAGNPNSGKTTIFNALTGAHQKVGNWPGVTVDVMKGFARRNGYTFDITDLPGTYSLSAESKEERIARDYILDHRPDVIVQVIEGPNIERNLYLTLQLIELEVPLVIALNMYDEVKARGIKIDIRKLSELLGVPIVPTIGKRGRGMRRLMDRIIDMAENPGEYQKPVKVNYGFHMEEHIAGIENIISLTGELKKKYPSRWMALGLIEADEYVAARVKKATSMHEKLFLDVMDIRKHMVDMFKIDPEEYITEQRYGFINGALKESVEIPEKEELSLTEKIDSVITNRILGLPILFFLMWLLFQATFGLGAYPMEWIDMGVAYISSFMDLILPAGVFKSMIIDGIIGGVGSVIIFLPNILILFFGISILEDSGYMARAAFVTDRVMHALGLHGKSFIPLLMGFGCAVPAVMATRMLESRRDRIITMLVVPLMSCSARLPVYILIAGIFFPKQAGNIIFLLYIIGILLALIAARVLGTTLFKGESSPFVMELPPYRVPTGKSVVLHMWIRARLFLRKMGGVILIGSVVLWFLGAFPKMDTIPPAIEQQRITAEREYNQALANAESSEEIRNLQSQYRDRLQQIAQRQNALELEHTFIGRIGHFIEPLVAPLGFNWQMGVSLISGFVAKEVVVSSLGVLYAAGDDDQSDLEQAIIRSGITPLAGFAFLLFTLIYTPCIATISAIARESRSAKWMLLSVSYQTALAWLAAFIVYQGGRLAGL